MNSKNPESNRVDVVIVGAGIAGMYQAHRMRELGLTVRGIEGGSDVGGTWFWNRYPGARCDVPSISYSYSFSPELDQEWTWSEKLATQPEILRYLNHVADRFDLRKYFTFNTWVTSATYDEEQFSWTVTTDSGEAVTATYVVMATGSLTKFKKPEVEGIDDFAGETYHTARWPHEGVDFAGKRVAVIGTGSTGIQSIPLIAEQAESLTVFQRTPNFVTPAWNRPMRDAEVAETKECYPEWREAQRGSRAGFLPIDPVESVFEVLPGQRRERFEAAWNGGVLGAVLMTFNDLRTDLEANEIAANFVREKIRETVVDPAVAEDLCPTGYAYGAKRPCLGAGYLETFNRDNVELVNLRRTPMEALTVKGIRTSEREHEFDAIVFATGFDAVTGAVAQIDVRGRGGLTLKEKWADGPRALMGLMTEGFPNFFMVTGPTSPGVLTNMYVSIEHDVDWITDCISHLRENEIADIEPTLEAENDWIELVEKISEQSLFSNSESWYNGANVPGKPRAFLVFVGGLEIYRARCAEAAAEGYQAFQKTRRALIGSPA